MLLLHFATKARSVAVPRAVLSNPERSESEFYERGYATSHNVLTAAGERSESATHAPVLTENTL